MLFSQSNLTKAMNIYETCFFLLILIIDVHISGVPENIINVKNFTLIWFLVHKSLQNVCKLLQNLHCNKTGTQFNLFDTTITLTFNLHSPLGLKRTSGNNKNNNRYDQYLSDATLVRYLAYLELYYFNYSAGTSLAELTFFLLPIQIS